MKTKFYATLIASLLLVCMGLVSGCSSTTPDQRIRRNQELFNSLPPDAQASIRDGQVQVGFTPDMVLLALGEPSNRSTRTTQSGTSEVWTYSSRSSSSSVNFGVGMGTGSRGSGMSTAVGVSGGTGGNRSGGDRARIVFTNGKVSSIESATSR